MMRAVAALAGLTAVAGLSRPVPAHERWASGDPVPAWVKAQCCGPADAHRLTAGQVHLTPEGYRVDGYSRAIKQDRLLPSPDGSWWVFYRDYDDGSQSTVYCFFGPEPAS